MNFFRLFDLDRISFWFGFLTATLFWWLYGILRPVAGEAWKRGRENLKNWGRRWQTGTEIRLRQDMLNFAQEYHLAAAFAPLDDLLIPPRLISPPVYIDPDAPTLLNGVRQIVPYMPAWPEVETVYNAPHLSLVEALQRGANIVVIGHPGYGKSVALADLTSRLARQDKTLGRLAGRTPLFVHIHDLDLAAEKRKTLDILVDGLRSRVSRLTQTRLPQVVRTQIEDGNALLLLDGLDELTPEELQQATAFLGSLLKKHPKLQIVTTSSVEYYDGLTALGFFPMALRAWGQAERQSFLEKWQAVWRRVPVEQRPNQNVPTEILTGWLYTRQVLDSPLEHVLSLWALFAGDALGDSRTDAIEAHIRRTSESDQRAALGLLAWNIVQGTAVSPSLETPSLPTVSEEDKEAPSKDVSTEEAEDTHPPEAQGKAAIGGVGKSNLLVERKDGTHFVHPVFCAWLAAEYAATHELEKDLFTLPPSPLQHLTQRYLAAQADVSAQIQSLLIDSDDDPLYRDLLRTARWLSTTPTQTPWRSLIMRNLVRIIQSKNHPFVLRARCVAALALSDDPGAGILLRRLMVESPTATLRYLGALGSGLLQDQKSYPVLETLLKDNDLRVQRMACLALSTQKHPKALETVVQVLASSSEQMRKIAAEALANHPGEGYDVLRDGSTFDDLLVRRAVVYGLLQVPEAWARETLERMQLEDGEWVVRAAAEQALKQFTDESVYVPQALPPLQNTPWLLETAAEQGRGISNTEQALEILTYVLRNGTVEQQIQALYRLRLLPNVKEGLVAAIYALLYGDDPDLQTAAFDTLVALNAQGVPLPPPRQFGLA